MLDVDISSIVHISSNDGTSYVHAANPKLSSASGTHTVFNSVSGDRTILRSVSCGHATHKRFNKVICVCFPSN